MRELCLTLDNFWFPAHLLDLLHHSGGTSASYLYKGWCLSVGSGINIPDHMSESLKTGFWVKNTQNSLMEIRIRDPRSGMEKSDPG
jgi:hypothetical protein